MISCDEIYCNVHSYDPANNQFNIILKTRQDYVPGRILLLKNQFVFSVQRFTTTSKILDLSSTAHGWVSIPRLKTSQYDFGFAVLNDCVYFVSYTNILIIYIFFA